MDDEILQEFLAESWENLGRLDTEIVALEKDPRDNNLLASIFRTIHTIKGTCGFIGLNHLGDVAHSAENVLGKMRDGRLDVSPSAISLVLSAIDRIKELLGGLEESGHEPELDSSELIQLLNELAESSGMNELIYGGQDAVAVEAVAFPEPPAAVAPPPPPVVATPVHAPAEAAHPAAPEHRPATQEPAAGTSDENAKKSVADLSIRVQVDVLDRLMNLVGELVLTRNQLMQMVRGEDESKYHGPIAHLNRVTTDLQEGVMKTRMQPIGNAWSKLPRLVRDLSQQTGKFIELEMQGEETELDRTVLDAIKDPLTHMIRNSADHGLEAPAVRRQANKSEVGRIRLNAFHEGGHVIICVSDDGAGINLARVREKAIRNGLVSETDASRLSDKEILNFVFQPGFSTADKVSAVSGRGVGMDVVRTQIERIGGTVDLTTRPGQGTNIRIKIPLTLAIISSLVVECAGHLFAIPQLGVVELVRVAAEDRQRIEKIYNNEVFRLRDRLLPLIRLHEVLGLTKSGTATDSDTNIVVVQVGDEQFGLIVGEVHDTQEIVVKPVGSLLKDLQIYQGTTILGDGQVIMILDVAGILREFGDLGPASSDRDKAGDHDINTEGQVTSILLVESGSQTLAVPLSLVARLEEIPRNEVERTGERMVVQYRGDLLPLLPVYGRAAEITADPQPVVVFSEQNRSLGLMVDRIQDILEDRLQIRMASRQQGLLGTAVVGGRAVDVIDIHYYIQESIPDWFDRKIEARSHRVLYIDDSSFMRQMVTTALESASFRVATACHAEQAQNYLDAGERFDAIISDIEMPGMNGYEFARWYRQRWPGDEMPLIALTSLWSSQHQTQGEQAGFTRYLKKYDSEELLSVVRELLQTAQLGMRG